MSPSYIVPDEFTSVSIATVWAEAGATEALDFIAITPETLAKLTDAQLRELHREMMRLALAGPPFPQGLNLEEWENRLLFVQAELKRRGIAAEPPHSLDREASLRLLAGLPDEVTLIEDFVRFGGAFLTDETADDGIEVLMRDGFQDSSRDLKLHRTVLGATNRRPVFALCPDGFPEGDHLRGFDLVLRRRRDLNFDIVNEPDFQLRVYGSASVEQRREALRSALADFVIVSGFVCATGSYIYHAPDRKPNDIDIVVKCLDERDEIIEALGKPAAQAAGVDVHWVWEPRGPNWSFLPLYDLVCRAARPLREAKVRALRVPDPEFLLERMRADFEALLLSAVTRAGMEGEEFLLVNERVKPEEPIQGYAFVSVEQEPDTVPDVAALGDRAEGLDAITRREFTARRGPFFVLRLKLIRELKKAVPLPKPPPGRRFSGEFEFKEARRALDAIILKAPHGELVWRGEKRIILKGERIALPSPAFVATEDRIFGVVWLAPPAEIGLDEFGKLARQHRVTEEERKRDWPDAKTLWAYPITRFEGYVPPIRFARKPGTQVVQKDVTLSEAVRVRPGTFFLPQKPVFGFREPKGREEAWAEFVKPALDRKQRVSVELKADGVRLLLHRLGGRGSEVRIFTEKKGLERSEYLPELTRALKELPGGDFILDAETILLVDGKPGIRREFAPKIAVQTKEPVDKNLRAWVFDILWSDGKDLTELPYAERLEVLKRRLPEARDPIRRLDRDEVKTFAEFSRAVAQAEKLPGSEGAMLKFLTGPDSEYAVQTARSRGLAKLKTVTTLSALVIGRRKQPAPFAQVGLTEPKAPVSGEAAKALWRKLVLPEKTYIFRVAIRNDQGKLQELNARAPYTPNDLELRWVPAGATDPLTKQENTGPRGEWRGTDDPAVWEMASGWPQAKRGEFQYAKTFAVRLEPTPSPAEDLIEVQVGELQEWKDDAGKTRWSWTFPAPLETVLEKRPADAIDSLRKTTRFISEIRESLAVEVLEPFREEGQLPSQQEIRRALERRIGDWYMVKQPPGKSFPATIQRHSRGIWTEGTRRQVLKSANAAMKLEPEEREKTLARIWRENDMAVLQTSVEAIRRSVSRAMEEKKPVSAAVARHVDGKFPGPARYSALLTQDRIINRGNAHSDLRSQTPGGETLIGWTLDTPGVLIQFLRSGRLVEAARNKLTDPEKGDLILVQKKSPQPLGWLTLLTPARQTFEAEIGQVGATRETAGRFDLVAGGGVPYPRKGGLSVVYGVRRSNFHEQFHLYSDPEMNRKMGGRWTFRILRLGGERDVPEAVRWLARRADDARPFIFANDFATEVTQAKREKTDLFWNAEAIPILEKLGYFKTWGLEEELQKFKASPRAKAPPQGGVSRNRPAGRLRRAPEIFGE